MTEQSILHEFKLISNQPSAVFARFIKNTILVNYYKSDLAELQNSTSAWMFKNLFFPIATYLGAKPQAFGIRSTTRSFPRDYGTAIEIRKSKTGFLQALLGKHPLHFMKNQETGGCPKCGAHHTDIMGHALLDCPSVQSERMTWISHLDNLDLDTSDPMNMTIKLILKESAKPVRERMCSNNTILLIAFGGHTALQRNGDFVVTRKELRRLNVSDLISRRTADFLHIVHTKFKT